MKTKNKLLLPLGALAAGFGMASTAFAQTAEPPRELPTIKAKATKEPQGKDSLQATETQIGKGKQEIRDIPQSITVVTERLMDDRNLDTLKDTLKQTAGISFLAAEGAEEDIRLRGFPLQATGDVFVDGIRDPAFYERDTFNYERVEVLRGSASMLFGRGSTGGAVNQVNKLPRLIDRHSVDVTVGSQANAVPSSNAKRFVVAIRRSRICTHWSKASPSNTSRATFVSPADRRWRKKRGTWCTITGPLVTGCSIRSA
jgi:catecholate siderophore receptor